MATDFRTLVIGPLQSNCYLVWDRSSLEAAVIDPGDELDHIVAAVSDLSLKVKYILLTHAHPDHCFVAGNAARALPAEIAMHPDEVDQIDQGLVIAEMFYDVPSFMQFSPSILLSDGEVLPLGDSYLEVMLTPGHSPGGLCFVTDAGVFCGDTIFAGSIGRTDFPGGSYEQLMLSIRARILTMKDETPLYPGHGPATTVGEERASNPFLV